MTGDRTLTLSIHEQFVVMDALRQRQTHLERFPGMAVEVDAIEAIRGKLLDVRRSAIAEVLAESEAMRATSAALAPRIAALEAEAA